MMHPDTLTTMVPHGNVSPTKAATMPEHCNGPGLRHTINLIVSNEGSFCLAPMRAGYRALPVLAPSLDVGQQDHEPLSNRTTVTWSEPPLQLQACRAPAVKGRNVCHIHGGRSPGAPKGNAGALKHGH